MYLLSSKTATTTIPHATLLQHGSSAKLISSGLPPAPLSLPWSWWERSCRGPSHHSNMPASNSALRKRQVPGWASWGAPGNRLQPVASPTGQVGGSGARGLGGPGSAAPDRLRAFPICHKPPPPKSHCASELRQSWHSS